MKEIEVKILDINKKILENKLKSLSAKKVSEGELSTLYLDTKNKDIHHNKNMLRIRTSKNGVILCLKTKMEKKETKSADEYETKVSDLNNTLKILNCLGICVVEEVKKHRTSYKINNVHFDIDTYLGNYSYIPTFFEIEAVNKKDILKYVKLLGFKESDAKPWTLGDLIRHYSKKNKTK
ncbi:MAG: class IV adenylate cyclase [Candidatus Woesearchaeota archaeon]|jgi:predicted adenylyl cyclase CyaB